MKTDNQTLLDTAERAFELAVHPDLSQAERKQHLDKGLELRARLMTLLTAEFRDGTPAVIEANTKIRQVNAQLRQKLADIQSVVDTVAALTQLVSILDDLFKLPFSFV